ncbi:MAG TPA: twin-arginine translocation signal domain-containing protein [Ktedonobacteraceae bacterium]|nr:twin-arginine translocation signal domain-containing protein [Ktedonobacteraceae bacterium]
MSFQKPISRRRFLSTSAVAAGSVVGAGALLNASRECLRGDILEEKESRRLK